MRLILILSIMMLAVLSAAFAQDVELHGFAQTNYAVRVADTGDPPANMSAADKDIILGEERLQLEFAHYSESGNTSFSAKLDFLRDAMDSTMRFDVREAYLDMPLWKLDTRIGRQIITWGLGDLVFINDTFPKDWIAFLSGQPLQYLKVASDALSVSLSTDPISAQVTVIPFFQPDNLPRGERLFYYDPLPLNRQFTLPDLQYGNIEVAGRLYRTMLGFDASLYAYRGFSRMPAVKNITSDGSRATLFYPELGVYGVSFQGSILGGLLSVEGGYYDFVDDRNGDNPFVENPQARFLVGYQQGLSADLTVGLQYYAESMLEYDAYENSLPVGFPLRDRIRHNITLRITQFLKYQTLRFSLFGWFSPNEEDYFVNPEIRYSLTDELWGAIGANILGGTQEHTFLGQFEQNDNVYLTVRYGF